MLSLRFVTSSFEILKTATCLVISCTRHAGQCAVCGFVVALEGSSLSQYGDGENGYCLAGYMSRLQADNQHPATPDI